MLSNKNGTDNVLLVIFYSLKVHVGEDEVKRYHFTHVILLIKSSYRRRRGESLAKFCVLLYGCPLETFSCIGIRFIKSSFDLAPYKALQIIFNYFRGIKNTLDTS